MLDAAEKEMVINLRGGLYEVGTDHQEGGGGKGGLLKIFIDHDIYVKITWVHEIN